MSEKPESKYTWDYVGTYNLKPKRVLELLELRINHPGKHDGPGRNQEVNAELMAAAKYLGVEEQAVAIVARKRLGI